MTGVKYIKVHWRAGEQHESRAGSQTMGHLPMVVVYSLVMYLYVYFHFLFLFHRHCVPNKNVCVVSI